MMLPSKWMRVSVIGIGVLLLCVVSILFVSDSSLTEDLVYRENDHRHDVGFKPFSELLTQEDEIRKEEVEFRNPRILIQGNLPGSPPEICRVVGELFPASSPTIVDDDEIVLPGSGPFALAIGWRNSLCLLVLGNLHEGDVESVSTFPVGGLGLSFQTSAGEPVEGIEIGVEIGSYEADRQWKRMASGFWQALSNWSDLGITPRIPSLNDVGRDGERLDQLDWLIAAPDLIDPFLEKVLGSIPAPVGRILQKPLTPVIIGGRSTSGGIIWFPSLPSEVPLRWYLRNNSVVEITPAQSSFVTPAQGGFSVDLQGLAEDKFSATFVLETGKVKWFTSASSHGGVVSGTLSDHDVFQTPESGMSNVTLYTLRRTVGASGRSFVQLVVDGFSFPGPGGEFMIEDAEPGEKVLSACWRQSDGCIALLVRNFSLSDGEYRDFGIMSPDQGPVVSVDTRFRSSDGKRLLWEECFGQGFPNDQFGWLAVRNLSNDKNVYENVIDKIAIRVGTGRPSIIRGLASGSWRFRLIPMNVEGLPPGIRILQDFSFADIENLSPVEIQLDYSVETVASIKIDLIPHEGEFGGLKEVFFIPLDQGREVRKFPFSPFPVGRNEGNISAQFHGLIPPGNYSIVCQPYRGMLGVPDPFFGINGRVTVEKGIEKTISMELQRGESCIIRSINADGSCAPNSSFQLLLSDSLFRFAGFIRVPIKTNAEGLTEVFGLPDGFLFRTTASEEAIQPVQDGERTVFNVRVGVQ